MILFHRAQLLLLLLVVFKTDGSKIDDVIKKIGKRFLPDWFFPAAIQSLTFSYKTEDEVNAARNHSAEVIGQHLMRQSSVENLHWQESSDILSSLMDSDFKSGVCRDDKKLNYYQTIEYWKRQRKEFKRNDREKVTWKMLPADSPDKNNFMVSFKVHSNWSFSSTKIFIVQMELLGSNKWSNYSLTGIEEVGACTEHGTVKWRNTDFMLTLHETDPEKAETHEKIVAIFGGLFDTEKSETMIPSEWMSRTATDAMFEGLVCHGDTSVKYGKEELFKWWKKFQLMYHPVENDAFHSEVQLLGGEFDRLVFRATLKVKLGSKKERPVEKREFKFEVKYNVDGSELWWINKFEVMCSPIPNQLMQKHADAYREMIGARIGKMMESPEMWYTSLNAFNDLISPNGVEIENCAKKDGSEMEKSTNIADLQHKFWEENKKTNGKMSGYNIESDTGISEIGEKMWVEILIFWTPLEANTFQSSKWTFHLEWDTRLQYYKIYKMILGCPESGTGNKEYNSFVIM